MFRHRSWFAAPIFVGMILMSGCGGSDSSGNKPPETGPNESVVTLEGKPYTCEQVVGLDCGEKTQQIFDAYKENIVGFINSGKLAALNSDQFTFEEVAYTGMMACAHAPDGETAYIDFMLKNGNEKLHNLPRTDFLAVWFEASKSLCPGEAFASDVEGSPEDSVIGRGDRITP